MLVSAAEGSQVLGGDAGSLLLKAGQNRPLAPAQTRSLETASTFSREEGV
jgi:hypothetical protein